MRVAELINSIQAGNKPTVMPSFIRLYTLFIVSFLILNVITAYSQKKSAVIGDMISRPNAILILNPPNGDQGFLLPQLSTANRLSVLPTSPADDGLVVFDITEQSFYYWSNGLWLKGLGSGALDQTLAYNPVTQKLSLSGSTGNEVDLSSLKEIPSQIGHVGKYLTTDGVTLSWLTFASLGTITNINTGIGLTGGPITNTGTISIADGGVNTLQLTDEAITTAKITDGAVTSAKLNTTGVALGTYGSATEVSQITVDEQGRITAANNVAITGAAPIGTAGGDLEGTYPNPTISDDAITTSKINDGAVTSAKLNATGVALGTYGSATEVSQITVDTQGRITAANNVAITGAAPIGTAGGNLEGTYPNPTISDDAITTSKINDGAVTSTKLNATGVVLGTYGSTTEVSQITVDAQGRITAANNVAIIGAAPIGAAGGDLTGTYPNPTVAEIRGNLINNATLGAGDTGKALVWDGTQWIATVVPGNTLQTSYYSIDPADFVILKANGQIDKHNLAVFEADNTFVTSGKDSEGESIMASLHLPHGAQVNQVIVYYWDSESTAMNVRLIRKDLNAETNGAPIINWNSTGSVNAIRTQTFVVAETISNELSTYRIIVDLNINSNSNVPHESEQRIYGIRIRYQH